MLYLAYGLGLEVSQPVARLHGTPEAKQVAVHIQLNRRPTWSADDLPARLRYESPYHQPATGEPILTVWQLGNGWFRWRYADATEFFVDPSGSQVWVAWPANYSVDDVSSYLLGPVLGFVLRLRRRVCLHASAIAAGGQAFAIAGPPGSGKSTTAAAFGVRGHAVLSDDIVPLLEVNEGFEAQPGYPRLRLWPSSFPSLVGLGMTVPTLPPQWGERRYHLDISDPSYKFESQPLPLSAVYMLGERRDSPHMPWVEPLSGEEGVMMLISHSFSSGLLDREMRARDLEVLSQLAARVPLRSVRPHADPARLSRLCDVILEDFLSTVTTDRLPVAAS